MNKTLASKAAALVLGTLLTVTPALAEEFSYAVNSCTKDGQTASLDIVIKGQSTNGSDVQAGLQKVWDETVHPLTGPELMNPHIGFVSFLTNISAAWDGMSIHDGEEEGNIGIKGQPVVGPPACTPQG